MIFIPSLFSVPFRPSGVKAKSKTVELFSNSDLFQPLEPRVLTTVAPDRVPAASLPAVVYLGNHADAQPRGWAWLDSDLDVVTPAYAGRSGYAELHFAEGVLTELRIENSNAQSTLNLRTTASAQGDGLVTLLRIVGGQGESGLASLDLRGAAVTRIDLHGLVKTLRLGEARDGDIHLGGTVRDAMAIEVTRAMDGSIAFPGRVTSLNVSSWIEGLLNVGSLGQVIARGDFGVEVVTTGGAGIGSIKVFGGDLTSIIDSSGPIGTIHVTGVAIYSDDFGGYIRGGNLSSDQIYIRSAGSERNGIGRITLIGGSFSAIISGQSGEDGEFAGNVAGIVTRPIRYLEYVDPDTNQKYFHRQGGGAAIDLLTLGKIGPISLVGGSLEGSIDAAKGIGDIYLKSFFRDTIRRVNGLVVTVNDYAAGHAIANLTAFLRAAPGPGKTAIASVTIDGGSFGADVYVVGAVGPITIQGILLADPYFTGQLEVVTGYLVGNIAASSIGLVTVTGGFVRADFTATYSFAGIVARMAEVTSGIEAGNSIGDISNEVVVMPPQIYHPDDGETIVDLATILGGDIELTISLGRRFDDSGTINPAATLGTITGIGANVYVSGEVPFQANANNPLVISRRLVHFNISDSRSTQLHYEVLGGMKEVYLDRLEPG